MDQHEAQSERYRKLIESSMQKYSDQLGWGLTGSQSECWVMLDIAVDNAAKYNALINDLAKQMQFLQQPVVQAVAPICYRLPVLRNVYRRKGGHKFMVDDENIHEINASPGDYDFVCEKPHEDGTYGYECDFEWCRCKQ